MNTYYGVSAWQWQSGSDYLAHHGILGQRWGKRNGPPYPLSAGAHSSAEKRLKSKNEGKLESWKAKERAKVSKAYDRDVDRVEGKLLKLDKKVLRDVHDKHIKKHEAEADKLIGQHEALKKAKEKEIDTIDKMRIEDVSRVRAQKGRAIVKGLLEYGAISGLRSVAMRGSRASLALGNVPLALIFSAINFAATIPQLHLIVKAVSRARTRVTETDDEARKRRRKERLVTAGIITADTLFSVLAEMLGTAYVGPRSIMRA